MSRLIAISFSLIDLGAALASLSFWTHIPIVVATLMSLMISVLLATMSSTVRWIFYPTYFWSD